MSEAALSIVIPCVNGLPIIHECLQSVARQHCGFKIETIVVECCGDSVAAHIRRSFPEVKLLSARERLGVPELRAIGMSHASGRVIAVIEDHCLVSDNWAAEILKAHESEYAAIGGATENASVDRLTDWAAFFCEYSHSMLPIPDAESEAITGNNASYKRDMLERVNEDVKRSCWEYFLHEELKKLGGRFRSSPRILVYHKKRFGFWYFISQRFHYSRSFAAMRAARVTLPRRVLYLMFSPLLPIVMSWRITTQIMHKRRLSAKFLAAFPLLTAFLASYAVGEFTGYLLGPGNSLTKVE